MKRLLVLIIVLTFLVVAGTIVSADGAPNNRLRIGNTAQTAVMRSGAGVDGSLVYE